MQPFLLAKIQQQCCLLEAQLSRPFKGAAAKGALEAKAVLPEVQT